MFRAAQRIGDALSGKRVPLVVGNWKLNTTVTEGMALARDVAAAVASGTATVLPDVAILPPFTHLWPIRQALDQAPASAGGGTVRMGAQDVFWLDSGAYTGEISPMMLSGLCDLVLVGHSERRHLFGETDAAVNRKLRRSLAHRLDVVIAVGETEAQRDVGDTLAVVNSQLDAGFEGVTESELEHCVIAYEPVWAIGTGRTATLAEAQAVCAALRGRVAEKFSAAAADRIRVLYGGSVTPSNAPGLFAAADIDGGLIGGASLNIADFSAIVAAAGAVADAMVMADLAPLGGVSPGIATES